MSIDPKVDFGYESVTPEEKTRRVRGVFDAVADRYDVMNDVISLGTHRLLKRMTVEMSGVRARHCVLDLAGGTGDFAALYAPIVGTEGAVVLADINPSMTRIGRDRLLNEGHANVRCVQTSAEHLAFNTASFNCVTIGFGLRNFTDKDAALREIHRVLKPGGVLLVLEFSTPEHPLLRTAYEGFQALWPGLGRMITGDSSSYEYLVESIRVHPPQKALKQMLGDAGFVDAQYHNLLGGIAAIHRGSRAP
jgi:demethylmenaquinone methyltransferase/2-methoxy-6-polyprenyl-1,4-benzoquinol methylase